ncbi:helix-turn-helix domain-containing protein [Aliiglaciecola sp. M165]|uniref:helix-turn-helix domain-containing protein n=1 Tax=Aliiglaciecola sp. M165 TaxID=2593649 RepID=UPI00117D290B|nr:helix-turn-helix domain-containing protein [Aliiglaciecola sp. M165]TRY33888.1 helix-turn-helix domain-containing protein [Aliiglaciecola sp. M165]
MKDTNSIKVERLKKGWTQAQLAEITGLSERTIQRLENGAQPSIESLNALATVFEVDLKSFESSNLRKHFSAPIDRKLLTAFIVLWLLIMAIEFFSTGTPFISIFFVTLTYLVFSIQGYSVIDNRLLIHHIGWSSNFDLSSLSSIEVNPYVMMGAIRIFGVSALFVSTGRFRSNVIGKFKAYITNPKNGLVLRFDDEQIVITPDDPEAMHASIEESISRFKAGKLSVL